MNVDAERIHVLDDAEPSDQGSYVLYWMQQSQRAHDNQALEYAVALADDAEQSVIVGFGLDDRYPDANERSLAFLLEGLAETASALAERDIKLVLRRGRPDEVALELARNASVVVCDRGDLRHQRRWRRELARSANRRVVEVEGDVVVPVETASDKPEYAARTIRPKIQSKLDDFLVRRSNRRPKKSSLSLHVTGELDPRDPEGNLARLDVDRTVGRVERFRGGTSEARRHLGRFLRNDLPGYADARNDPADPTLRGCRLTSTSARSRPSRSGARRATPPPLRNQTARRFWKSSSSDASSRSTSSGSPKTTTRTAACRTGRARRSTSTLRTSVPNGTPRKSSRRRRRRIATGTRP